MSFLESLVGTMLVISAVLWVTAVWKMWHREPLLPRREREPVPVSGLAVLLVALSIGTIIAGKLVAEDSPEPSLRDVQTTALFFALLMAILLPILAMGSGGRLEGLGIRLDDVREQVAAGVIGFHASLLPVFLLAALLPWRTVENQHVLLRLLARESGPAIVFWIALSVVVLAPLAEELTFRVVLQGRLQQLIPPRAAIAITAAIFSVVHGWQDALPLMPLALVLGYVYYQRNSYLAAVVVHSLFNASNLLLALGGS